jgi:hypothetical protein
MASVPARTDVDFAARAEEGQFDCGGLCPHIEPTTN